MVKAPTPPLESLLSEISTTLASMLAPPKSYSTNNALWTWTFTPEGVACATTKHLDKDTEHSAHAQLAIRAAIEGWGQRLHALLAGMGALDVGLRAVDLAVVIGSTRPLFVPSIAHHPLGGVDKGMTPATACARLTRLAAQLARVPIDAEAPRHEYLVEAYRIDAPSPAVAAALYMATRDPDRLDDLFTGTTARMALRIERVVTRAGESLVAALLTSQEA